MCQIRFCAKLGPALAPGELKLNSQLLFYIFSFDLIAVRVVADRKLVII